MYLIVTLKILHLSFLIRGITTERAVRQNCEIQRVLTNSPYCNAFIYEMYDVVDQKGSL